MTTTGYLFDNLPAGPERDQALGLVRVGLKFQAQQSGRKSDSITRYLASLARGLPKCSISALLEKLETESFRHDYGAGACACTRVNRIHETVTFWHPKRGETEISFPSLIVKLSRLKKSSFGTSLVNTKPKC